MDLFVKVFKALGEPTRLKILRILSVRPMYVCELESVLGMSQPRISQHLRVLKESGILREAREAQKNFYMLNGDIIDRVFSDFGQFLQEDIGKLPGFAGEADRIANLDRDVCVQNCKKNSRSDC